MHGNTQHQLILFLLHSPSSAFLPSLISLLSLSFHSLSPLSHPLYTCQHISHLISPCLCLFCLFETSVFHSDLLKWCTLNIHKCTSSPLSFLSLSLSPFLINALQYNYVCSTNFVHATVHCSRVCRLLSNMRYDTGNTPYIPLPSLLSNHSGSVVSCPHCSLIPRPSYSPIKKNAGNKTLTRVVTGQSRGSGNKTILTGNTCM